MVVYNKFKAQKYEDVTLEANKDIDYESLLFRHLDRCGISFATPEKIAKENDTPVIIKPAMDTSIKWLAILFHPYLKALEWQVEPDFRNDDPAYWNEIATEIMEILSRKQMLMKTYLFDQVNEKDAEAGSFISSYCLKRMLEENKNCLIYNGGGTGSGKTFAMLSLAQEIYKMQDREFPFDHIVFRVDKFLELLNRKNADGTDYLVAGDVILFDETGVDANHHSWQSLTNQALSVTAQTFRERNLTVMFTCPVMNYIDSDTRKLFHLYFEMNGMIKSKNQSLAKCFEVTNNPKTSDMFFRYPKILKEGKVSTLKQIRFNLPSVKLRNHYRKIELEFKRGVTKDLEASIKKQVEAQVKKLNVKSNNDMAEEVVKDYKDFLKENRAGKMELNVFKIRIKFNLGRDKSLLVKHLAELKYDESFNK